MKKEVTITVEQASYQIGLTLVGLAQSCRTHLSDGFQPTQDVPAIIGENITGLLAAITTFNQISSDSKEDMQAFLNSWFLTGSSFLGVFLKK